MRGRVTSAYAGRAVVAAVCLLALSSPLAAQVNYTVTFDDPTNVFTAQERSDMTAAVRATGADWARYFQTATPVTLSVRITLDNNNPFASGRSGTSSFVNTVNNIDVYEQSAARKVRTGSLPFVPPYDIELTMNQNYLRNNLYFEPSFTARSGGIPAGRTDAYSVFTHELGHTFAFNGWRNPDGTLTTPMNPRQYQSTWDRFITVEANGDILFRGPNAMAIYGGPVPVTNGVPSHYGNAAGSGRPGSDLVPGLMNGVVFNFQMRYSISALDLAIAKDAGLTLAPFRWSGGSGDWATAARWNYDPAAGPNAVVPVGTPFDVLFDDPTATAYTTTLAQPVPLNSLTLASPNATLRHTAGALSVGTGTLTSGIYRLDGGRVVGGAWTSGGGRMTASANTANEVSGATLGAGVLDLSVANSYVRFTGGTAFATPTVGTTVGANSALALDQPTLTRGAITLNGGAVAVEGTRSVTLGPDVTVSVSAASGTGSVGRFSAVNGTGTLVNQGILQATGANATLTLNPTGAFTNTGTIRTTTPTARVHIQPGGTFTNSGLVSAHGSVTGGVTNTSGGQFYLNGTVSGALTVTGGTIGAGPVGPGILTVGSAVFSPGGAYRWQVKDWSAGATAGVGFDQLRSTGALDLSQLSSSNRFTVKVVGLTTADVVGAVPGFDSSVARSWVIGQFGNDLSGVPADRFTLDLTDFAASNPLNGGTFSLSLTSSGGVVLLFSPVPEPAIIITVGAVALAGYARLRRRRDATPTTAA